MDISLDTRLENLNISIQATKKIIWDDTLKGKYNHYMHKHLDELKEQKEIVLNQIKQKETEQEN